MQKEKHYGFHFREDGTVKGEKKYLSYSAIDLFEKDKTAYRKRYYEGKDSFSNEYTLYGHRIHKMVEDGLLEIPEHPKDVYKSEVKVECDIEGVRVLGYIDLFDPEKCRITDIKTSVNPWDNVRVAKLDQLPMYQLLVKKIYGKVSQYSNVVWLETRFSKPTTEEHEVSGFSVELETSRSQLELTGRVEVLKRRIAEWERKRIQDKIVRVAEQIDNDFTQWRLEHNPF
jgi:hypothetical protein